MKTEKCCTDEIELNGEVYIRKSIQPKLAQENGKQCVLIRSTNAGVHFGFLASEQQNPSGKTVTLSKTRRVYYWDGACSLSQMALDGVSKPQNCKFSVELPSNEIGQVIETIPITDKAMLNLYSVSVWKQ